jgi:hypothetical protein
MYVYLLVPSTKLVSTSRVAHHSNHGAGDGHSNRKSLAPAQTLELNIFIIVSSSCDQLIVGTGLANYAVLDEVSANQELQIM